MSEALAGVLATLLVLLSVLWLLRPWWSRAQTSEWRRRQANVAAYRQRLAEIEQESTAGLLSPELAAALRDEQAARLIEDAGSAPENAPTRRAGWAWALGLAALPVLIAIAGYGYQGSWRTHALIELAHTDPDGARRQAAEGEVARLAARLETHPDDREAWAMLGRALFVLGRYGEAERAYSELSERLDDQDPDVLVEQGEAMAMAQERSLAGKPRALFEAALQLAPANGKALWYAGLAAAEAADYATTYARWNALAAQELPPAMRELLGQRMGEVARLSGQPWPGTVPAADAKEALRLVLRVALDPALRAAVPDGAALFVFARAAQGPPMPLAVYRGLASELPAEVVLDDSRGVMPTMKLSQFPSWNVTARISRSGQAQPQPGDLQGSIAVTREQAAEALNLTIDQTVP